MINFGVLVYHGVISRSADHVITLRNFPIGDESVIICLQTLQGRGEMEKKVSVSGFRYTGKSKNKSQEFDVPEEVSFQNITMYKYNCMYTD